MVVASFNPSNDKDFLRLVVFTITTWIFKERNHLIYLSCTFFREANITHTSCLRSYLNFLHALLSQYILVMHLFLGSKKPNKNIQYIHMFLEGICFAEVGLPNGSCLQGTPKYKICFGNMCSFYLLVKNQLFVLMSI